MVLVHTLSTAASQLSTLAESKISASAAGDRGLMLHSKGTGYLLS